MQASFRWQRHGKDLCQRHSCPPKPFRCSPAPWLVACTRCCRDRCIWLCSSPGSRHHMEGSCRCTAAIHTVCLREVHKSRAFASRRGWLCGNPHRKWTACRQTTAAHAGRTFHPCAPIRPSNGKCCWRGDGGPRTSERRQLLLSSPVTRPHLAAAVRSAHIAPRRCTRRRG